MLADGNVLEAEYRQAFVAHVCREPMSCAALAEDGRVTVWAPTQSNSVTRDVVAGIAGLDAERVTVIRTLMGGGFGRRAEMDFAEHAVRAALAMPGTPVQVLFTREQDLGHDMYRPAALARLRGVLNADGRVSALHYHAATQSVTADYNARTPNPRGGNAERDGTMVTAARKLPYDIPNLRVTAVPRFPGVPVGYWRSPGSSGNTFLVEAFLDELAEQAGADPLAFRLRHLEQLPLHRAVLDSAATKAGWSGPLAPGQGRGISLTDSCGAICAQVIDVTLASGRLRINRITCAIDCRRIINPDGLRSQVEGSIVDGLAAALHGEVTFSGGVAQQSNFHEYRFPRLADIPPIHVLLLESGGRPGGAGEPALPAVAPALAGAIRAAGGPRIRSLPMAPRLAADGVRLA
jgi:isoquinoline 1-oxidoreductase beta subunit